MPRLQDSYVIFVEVCVARFIARIVCEILLSILLQQEGERRWFVSQCDLYARSFRAVQSGSLKVNVLVPLVPSRATVRGRRR